MKKYFILWVIFSFNLTSWYSSLDTSDFSEYINSDQPKVNLYFTLKEYYSNNINIQEQESLKQTAKYFSTTPENIKKIIKWVLRSCEKINKNFFWCEKLTIECLQKCYIEVNKAYNINLQKKIWEQIIKSSLVWENNLNDWVEDNWPYDLLVDIGKISKILFKEQIKEETASYGKINMKQVDIAPTVFWKNDNIDDILQQFKTVDDLEDELITQNKPKNVNNTNNQDNTNLYPTETTNKNSNTTSTTTSPTPIFPNSNFHIWNVCKITDQDNINTNSSSWNNTTSSSNLLSNILWLNSNDPQAQTFNIFDSDNQNQIVLNNQNSPNQNNEELITALSSWKSMCQWNNGKLLAICVQFIKSWPRWPVWWTTRVNSIQDIIQRISDSLKDAKQSFIVSSSHWDEALDIDYKHIKLDKIMAFNVVLTAKPVFRYKNNFIWENWEPDKWNEPDAQNCENIPKYLANLYTAFWIINCNSAKTDINKYLFTNFENVKLPKWDFSEGEIWLDNVNSTDWQKNTENQIWEFINLTTNFFDNLNYLLKDWQLAATTLKVKSE